MIIQEPKFAVIMMELIKHTASNKLKEMKKTIKDKYQNDFERLQKSQITIHIPQNLNYHAIIANTGLPHQKGQ